jgi:hypothetical protein
MADANESSSAAGRLLDASASEVSPPPSWGIHQLPHAGRRHLKSIVGTNVRGRAVQSLVLGVTAGIVVGEDYGGGRA